MTKNEPSEMCYCGKPLHYASDKVKDCVEKLIAIMGENVIVKSMITNKQYSIPRSYIALHGLKGSEVDSLGFPEVGV